MLIIVGWLTVLVGLISATPVSWTVFATPYDWLYSAYFVPYTTPLILATVTVLVGWLAIVLGRREGASRAGKWLSLLVVIHVALIAYYGGWSLLGLDLLILFFRARRRA